MIRQLARTAKSGLADILYRTGTLDVLLDKKLSGRIAVVMYHRVIADRLVDKTDSNPGIIVPEKQFDEQMRLIRDRFTPLSLDEFQSHVLNGTRPPARSCLITFDDGWVDNYDIAFPILRKYSVPAVIFLPCDYISTEQTFWQEEMLMRLTRMLSSDESHRTKLAEILGSRDDGYDCSVDGIRLFVISLKHESHQKIEDVLGEIRHASDDCVNGDDYNRHLTWEQVEQMRAAGVTFASHALSHRLLTTLTSEELHRELENSRHTLEESLGHPVAAIAYPNGDYDDTVLGATKEAGYALGFSTRHGLFEPGTNPLTIPRFNLHGRNGSTPARFMCTIGGIF